LLTLLFLLGARWERQGKSLLDLPVSEGSAAMERLSRSLVVDEDELIARL
jgi:hypothetical protein